MLTSGRTRDAFDLNLETPETRTAFGVNLVGSSLLITRSLVEGGVLFVSVHQEIFDHCGHAYDMHVNNFDMLRDLNLPLLDHVIPALLTDLDQRGLLDSTLVVVRGEMGLSPQVNSQAGCDHWPQCGFSLLFGGGVKQALVHGSTDAIGAYPTPHPVSPADFVSTIYELMDIEPHPIVPERGPRNFTRDTVAPR